MTKPADPQPSAQLAAGLGVLTGKVAQAIPKIIAKAKAIPFEGVARTVTLLPGLLLDPVNGNADPAEDRDWQLYYHNYQL